MSTTFACVLRSSRDKPYSPIWVDRIAAQARRFLEPDRIVCLTDFPGKWNRDIECIPLKHVWPGWWSKLELFRPGLFSGPVLYADLDSLFVRPMYHVWKTIENAGELLMLSDFYGPGRPASGVMAWVPSSSTEAIYNEFVLHLIAGMLTPHGDGGFIGQFDHGRLQHVFPGVFGSYKANRLRLGPKDFSHVSFHGYPRQHETPSNSWVREAWSVLDPTTNVRPGVALN